MATLTTTTSQNSEDNVKSMRRLGLKSRKNSTATTLSSASDTSSRRRSSVQDQKRKPSLASISQKLRWSRRGTNDLSPGQINRLGELFLDLPAEIQADVLVHLTTKDYLALRLTCKACLGVIQSNSNILARYSLQQSDLCRDISSELLQPYTSSKVIGQHRKDHLLTILHREKTIQRQIYIILQFLQTRVYMLKLHVNLQSRTFTPYRNGLQRCFHSAAWLIHHLLDSLRDIIVYEHRSHRPKEQQQQQQQQQQQSSSSSSSDCISNCSICTNTIQSIISTYPKDLLLPSYHLLHLIILQLRSATRAPTFVSTFERRLRGWRRDSPSDRELDHLIFLGGLEEVSKINEMEGSYGERMVPVTLFRDRVTEAARVNELAFPGVYESDPVTSGVDKSSLKSKGNADEDGSILSSHDMFLEVVTNATLSAVPETEQYLIGPNSVMALRLQKEGLIEHEREFMSPYGFVQKLMQECDGGGGGDDMARRLSALSRSDGDEVGNEELGLPGADPDEF